MNKALNYQIIIKAKNDVLGNQQLNSGNIYTNHYQNSTNQNKNKSNNLNGIPGFGINFETYNPNFTKVNPNNLNVNNNTNNTQFNHSLNQNNSNFSQYNSNISLTSKSNNVPNSYGMNQNNYLSTNSSSGSGSNLIKNNIITNNFNESLIKAKKADVTDKITSINYTNYKSSSNLPIYTGKGLSYEETLKLREKLEREEKEKHLNFKNNIVNEMNQIHNSFHSNPFNSINTNSNTKNSNFNDYSHTTNSHFTSNNSLNENNQLRSDNNSNNEITKNLLENNNTKRKPVSSTFDESLIKNKTETSFKNDVNSKVNNSSVPTSCISYAVKEEANYPYRDYMEDCNKIIDGFNNNPNIGLFTLYDGHGGKDTSNYIKDRIPEILQQILIKNPTSFEANMEKILIDTYESCDDELKMKPWAYYTGSTACLILTIKNNDNYTIYSANAGDSRSILINVEKNYVKRLSYDHKASDITEINRIKKYGGTVFNGRIFGSLAVSRAFGDYELKQFGVFATPHYSKTNTIKGDKYIIIASDGVWDVLNDDDILSLAKIYGKSSKELSETIVKVSLDKKSFDNISVIVVEL